MMTPGHDGGRASAVTEARGRGDKNVLGWTRGASVEIVNRPKFTRVDALQMEGAWKKAGSQAPGRVAGF